LTSHGCEKCGRDASQAKCKGISCWSARRLALTGLVGLAAGGAVGFLTTGSAIGGLIFTFVAFSSLYLWPAVKRLLGIDNGTPNLKEQERHPKGGPQGGQYK
jgi:hypothetical protein